MKLVKNSQGVKPLHHKGFNVRLRLVTRTLGFRLYGGKSVSAIKDSIKDQ